MKCEVCGKPVLVDRLCVECNDDWKHSDAKLTAEHVMQLARESFVARRKLIKGQASHVLDSAAAGQEVRHG